VQRVAARTWDTLELPPGVLEPDDLASLAWARERVAGVEFGTFSTRIRIGPFAGRLVIPPTHVIDVEELVRGTVANFIGLAHSGVRWADDPSAIGAAAVSPWHAIFQPYAREFQEYAGRGPEKRYLPQSVDTAIPRGRINLGRTLRRHRSRGRQSVVSCDVRILSEDTALNRLLLAAATRSERALLDVDDHIHLRTVREGLLFFQGVTLDPYPDVEAARADGDELTRLEPRLRQLAELIILGVRLLPEELDEDQPISGWVNVERVFEQAVLRVAEDVFAPAEVRRGEGDGVRLFTDGAAADADPDVVIDGGDGVWLADAKYRRYGADVTRDEIYQLMAHATAYNAQRAALVVQRMTSSDVTKRLGADIRGCRYDLLVVDAADARSLPEELAAWRASTH
jgi:hypothetical protein